MKVSGPTGFFLSAAAAAFLSACAFGTQFTRPAEDFIRLGETTRAQLQDRLGKPEEEKNFRQDGLPLKGIRYVYSNEAEAAKVPNTLCIRSLSFVLVDDIVIAEAFVSSCASDHTDFDEAKRSEIVKGTTRCDEVPSILGRPNWRGIYPLVKEKGETYLGYQFQYVKKPVLQFKTYEKELEIVCDSKGIVREVSFGEAGDR